MDARRIETILARFTLGFVAVYFPVETYASWRYGLLNPFYLVDLIATGSVFQATNATPLPLARCHVALRDQRRKTLKEISLRSHFAIR